MKYNTSRSQMSMPEYGRNIQAMIAHLATMEDRKKRLRCAEYIIDLMALFNPHCKAMEDYRHKLWDHLHFMADFDLDIDVPYPPPTKEELAKKPEPLPYPAKTTHHRHLGHNINILVERAVNATDPDKRQGLTQAIGYYMKLAYANWHREPVHEDMIRNEIHELSGGILKYENGGYKAIQDHRQNFNNRQRPAPGNSINSNSNNPNNRHGGKQASGNSGGYHSNNRNKNNNNGKPGNKFGNNHHHKNKPR